MSELSTETVICGMEDVFKYVQSDSRRQLR
jgi:hypothetical protein